MTEIELASIVLNELYNIQGGDLKKMDGYGSLNYRVKTKNEKFVLKLYPTSENVHLLHAENQLFDFLSKKFQKESSQFPKVLPTKDEKYISTYQTPNKTYYVRLLSFLEGTFFLK